MPRRKGLARGDGLLGAVSRVGDRARVGITITIVTGYYPLCRDELTMMGRVTMKRVFAHFCRKWEIRLTPHHRFRRVGTASLPQRDFEYDCFEFVHECCEEGSVIQLQENAAAPRTPKSSGLKRNLSRGGSPPKEGQRQQ